MNKSDDTNTFLRILGDIHGHYEWYLKLIEADPKPDHTIQIGDLGFEYSFLDNVDAERHRVLGGNHDNYDIVDNYPHFLGDFGVHTVPDYGDVFFVRGAFSVDHKRRASYGPKKSWWEEEELTVQQGNEALELYKEVKPDVLISHGCPFNVVPHVTDPIVLHNLGYGTSVIKTKTSMLLQSMAMVHRPKVHFFGHFHVDFDQYIDPASGEIKPDNCVPENEQYYTRYICVNQMEFVDVPKEFFQNLRE